MESQAASLVAIITSLIAIVSGFVAYSTKQISTSQALIVTILERQVAAGEKRELALAQDNKEQAITMGKMGTSLDRLSEQGAQTVRLLEDVVLGRQDAQNRRRSTGN